ncbi:MAG: ribosome biogenesis GTP-binding protein YihA/YsxC [Hyphomicrobiaceae bacterium]
MGAPALEHLPEPLGPEIAFAGRSNVGKSSLINAVTARRGLARTSNTPGRTQELNFFVAEGVALSIVDMPGYGFASAPKPLVDAWTRLIRAYLRGRVTLRRVFLLVDSRHGVKANDEEMMALLDEAAVPYQVVLTKCDKPGSKALAATLADTAARIARRPAAFPIVLVTSSEKGTGIDELRAAIAGIAASG